jgi:hypothetical protein
VDEQSREQLLSCLEDVKLDLEELGQVSSAVMVAQAVEMINGYASKLASAEKDRDEWKTTAMNMNEEKGRLLSRLEQCTNLMEQWRRLEAEDCAFAGDPATHGDIAMRAARDCAQQLYLVLTGLATVPVVERQSPESELPVLARVVRDDGSSVTIYDGPNSPPSE